MSGNPDENSINLTAPVIATLIAIAAFLSFAVAAAQGAPQQLNGTASGAPQMYLPPNQSQMLDYPHAQAYQPPNSLGSSGGLQGLTQQLNDFLANAFNSLANDQYLYAETSSLSQPGSMSIQLSSTSVPVTVGGVTTYVTLPPMNITYFIPNSLSDAITNQLSAILQQATAETMAQLQGKIQLDIQSVLQGDGFTAGFQLSASLSAAASGVISTGLDGAMTPVMQGQVGNVITPQTILSMESSIYLGLLASIPGQLYNALSNGLKYQSQDYSYGAKNTSYVANALTWAVVNGLPAIIDSSTYSNLVQYEGKKFTLSNATDAASRIMSDAIWGVSQSVSQFVKNNLNVTQIANQMIQNFTYYNYSKGAQAFADSLNQNLFGPFMAQMQGMFGGGFDASLGTSIQAYTSSYIGASANGNANYYAGAGVLGNLGGQFSSEFSGLFNSNLAASLSEGLGSALSSSIAGALSSQLAGSLSSSIAGGISGALSSGFADSLASQLSSALSNGLGSSLSSSISASASSSFAAVMGGAMSGQYGQSKGSTFAGQLQKDLGANLFSSLSSSLAGSLQSNLQSALQSSIGAAIQQNLEQGLQSSLQTSLTQMLNNSGVFSQFQRTLDNSLVTSLGEDLQNTLNRTFETSLNNSIQSSLQALTNGGVGHVSLSYATSWMTSTVASAVTSNLQRYLPSGLATALSFSLGTSLMTAFSSTSSSLSSAISTSIATSLTQQLSSAVSSGIGAGIGQGLSAGIGDSLQSVFQESLGADISGALGSSLQGTFGAGGSAGALGIATSSLGAATTSMFGSSFLGSIQEGIGSGFGTSGDATVFGGSSAGFSAGLGNGLGGALSGALGAGFAQPFSGFLNGNFTKTLGAGLGDVLGRTLGQAFGDTISNTLNDAFGKALGWGKDFVRALGDGISNTTQKSVEEYLGKNLSWALPSFFPNLRLGLPYSFFSNMFGSGMPDLSSETNMVSGTNMGSAESEIHQLPQDLGNMLMNELGVGVFNNDMNEVITTNYAYGFGQSVTTSSTSSTSGFVPPQAQQGPSTTIPPGTGPPPRAAPAPSSGEYSVSPTNSVVAYNNAVAGWFLTCPTPSQNGAMGMASTEPATKSIGGNACVNMDSSLVSSLILHARTYNFIFEPEWTQLDGVEPFNFAQLFTTVYAYSPQVDGELSNGFSTRSYIFDSVPSFAQHALWSWTAPYVDLTQALTPKLTYYVNPLGQLTWGQCTYGYTYQMYDVLDWIKNTAIPFDYANTVTGNSWASTGGQGTPTGSSTTGTGSGSVVQTAVAPSPQGIFGSGAIPTTSIAPAAFAGSNPAGTPAGTKSKNNNGFGIQYEPVLPYLFFNWNITFSPQTSYTTPNLTSPTEGVFTPLTYGGAINAIEPYPIDINGVMIANFSPDNGKTYNAFAFNNSGIAINLSSNTAIIGTQGYGLVSVASTPNDYIYLLLSQKNSDTTSYYIAIARAITKGYYQSPSPNFPNIARCTGVGFGFGSSGSTGTIGGIGSGFNLGSGAAYAEAKAECMNANLPSKFENSWNQYWQAAAVQDNVTVYLVTSPGNFIGVEPSFVPYNISVDYKGDVFLVGVFTQNSGGSILPASSASSASGSATGQGTPTGSGSSAGIPTSSTATSPGAQSPIPIAAPAVQAYSGSAGTISADYNQQAQQIDVTGSGFSPGESVTLYVDTSSGTQLYATTVTATGGAFSDGIPAAQYVSEGFTTLEVSGFGSVSGQTNTVQVTATQPSSGPTINAHYDSATGDVVVTGSGFTQSSPGTAGYTVTLTFLINDQESNSYTYTTGVNTGGTISTDVPAIKQPTAYTYYIYATQTCQVSTQNGATSPCVSPTVTVQIPAITATGSSVTATLNQQADSIDVTGAGFTKGGSVNLGVYSTDTNLKVEGASVTADQSGNIIGSLPVTLQMYGSTPMSYYVMATDVATSAAVKSQSVTLPARVNPVSMSASWNQQTDNIVIDAQGFHPSTTVHFTCAIFYGQNNPAPASAQDICDKYTTTDATGNIVGFNLNQVVPSSSYDIIEQVCGTESSSQGTPPPGAYSGCATATVPQRAVGVAAIMKLQNLVANTIGICTSINCFEETYALPPQLASVSVSDIASSPSGVQLYLSGQFDNGAIYVISGNDLTLQSYIPLGFSSQSETVTKNAQTRSSTTFEPASLNITDWLEFNGLYNQSIQWLPPKQNGADIFDQGGNNFDQNYFHHPLGIADINGYLYVLDDWKGIVGSKSSTALSGKADTGIFFNIILLRALNSTGSNIPIQPTYFNDMYTQQQCTMNPQVMSQLQGCQDLTSSSIQSILSKPNSQLCIQNNNEQAGTSCTLEVLPSLCNWNTFFSNLGNQFTGSSHSYAAFRCVTTGGNQQANYTSLSTGTDTLNATTYPPYGWVLSANITGVSNGRIQHSFSLCSSQACTLFPWFLTEGTKNNNRYYGGYAPIGPAITAVGNAYSGNCGAGTNGYACDAYETIYGTSFTVNYNNTAAILFQNRSNQKTQYEGMMGWGELLLANVDWQNYTNIFGGTDHYSCIVKGASIGGTPELNACSVEPYYPYSNNPGAYNALVDDFSAPIFLLGDPFKYYENIGTEQPLAYYNQLGSTFNSGNGGSSGSPSQTVSPSCLNQVSNGQIPLACASGQSSNPSAPSISTLGAISSAALQQQAPISVPVLTSNVLGGEVLVPFAYEATLYQSWTNFHYEAGYPCPPSIPDISEVTDQTEYTWATAPLTSATAFSANIEGGATYLQYRDALSNGPYIPNLSDYGTYLQPDMFMNVSTDRMLGGIYINITTSRTTNQQEVLNATQILNYVVNTHAVVMSPQQLQNVLQQQALGMNYETISSVPVGPKYGPSYAAGFPPTLVYKPISTQFTFNERQSPGSGFVYLNLYNIYDQFVWQSPLQFVIGANTMNEGSSSPAFPYGYRRLIYVLQDRFNNSIYVPIDADIGKFTVMNLNVSPVVDPVNSNQTTLYVTGTAGYYNFSNSGPQFYPLVNGNVFLYYRANINFLNYNSMDNSKTSGMYDALLCAFGTKADKYYASLNCQLANPIDQAQAAQAALQDYAPQYNSMSAQTCSFATDILPPTNYDCNIYKSNDLCQAQSTQAGYTEYCVPQDANGDGICTSQLGLIAVATTNSVGGFSAKTTACGIADATILAYYYGSPSPEPVNAIQSPLGLSANPSVPDSGTTLANPGIHPSQLTFPVFNWEWIPNDTASTFQIGLWELSYGNVTAVEVIGIVATVAVLLALKFLKPKPARRAVHKGKALKKKRG